MTDTDINTLRNGYDLLNNQVAQLDKELDGHKNMVKMLTDMQSALLSSASVLAEKLESEGVVLEPAQIELPFEVVN